MDGRDATTKLVIEINFGESNDLCESINLRLGKEPRFLCHGVPAIGDLPQSENEQRGSSPESPLKPGSEIRPAANKKWTSSVNSTSKPAIPISSSPASSDTLIGETDSIEATHTSAEHKIYSVMYREAIDSGTMEMQFGKKALSEKTGIRSSRTVRNGIRGLIEKKSIEVMWSQPGNRMGPCYRVYRLQEINERRQRAGIRIHPRKKSVVYVGTPSSSGSPMS